MTGLEQTFYIMGIVFMSLVFIMILALLAAVFVIRSKVNKIQHTIEHNIDAITHLAERGGELSAMASSSVLKQAKKVLTKNKK